MDKHTETGRSRVLVVDDNADAANMLALVLEEFGHETNVSYSGTEAIEQARCWRPSVVLLDIGMPGMDGYEVARALRSLPETESAILIALTGWGQDEDREQAKQAGFDRHLVKPVDAEELASLLSTREKPLTLEMARH